MLENDNRFSSPVFREYLEKAASDLGAAVEALDDDFGYLVRLHWKGKFINICGEALPLNTAAAARIVKDKWYTLKILRRQGFRVPDGQIFFRESYYRNRDFSKMRGAKDASLYAARLGYPVVVKPNSMSYGREVALAHDEKEFSEALAAVFNLDPIALVQEPVPGDDVRILLLDGELMLAYRRKVLSVEGDGKRSVGELIDALNLSLKSRDRCGIDPRDREIALELRKQDFDSFSIPGKGQRIVLKAFNLNLASGAQAEEITGDVGPDWLGLCGKICKELNLRYAGIDLKCGEPGRSEPVVLEANSAPSLKQWYLTGHKEQVVGIYKTLLERIFVR